MLTALIRDPRDEPVIRLVAKLLLFMVPPAALLFVHFNLALAVIYLALLFFRGGPPFSALVHEVAHRPVFTRRWLWAGRAAVEWIVCPLFGMSPHLYAAQHVGMHHPENNLAGDASATIHSQRDSVLDFARYFARFLFLAHWEVLVYLFRVGKTRLLKRAIVGLVAHHAVTAVALAVNWRAAIVVLVLPYVITRLNFSAGNWAQHGFVDPANPSSPYLNTITCVCPDFNAITFNSGFHIAHHADLRVHWSQLPAEFERDRARYRSEGAIVFEGIEFGQVFLALMFKRYRWLAAHHVECGDSIDVISERLARRTSRIRSLQPTAHQRSGRGPSSDPASFQKVAGWPSGTRRDTSRRGAAESNLPGGRT